MLATLVVVNVGFTVTVWMTGAKCIGLIDTFAETLSQGCQLGRFACFSSKPGIT